MSSSCGDACADGLACPGAGEPGRQNLGLRPAACRVRTQRGALREQRDHTIARGFAGSCALGRG